MDKIISTPLKQVFHSKGDIFHAMKKSDAGFDGFGEAYFSTINKNTIKGWKRHTKMTLNIVVPVGKIEFVIYDNETREFEVVKLSQDNYQRLTIRPGLWMAFRGCDVFNMLLNLASIGHDPEESHNKSIEDIKYAW